jgi:hypothetical protein
MTKELQDRMQSFVSSFLTYAKDKSPNDDVLFLLSLEADSIIREIKIASDCRPGDRSGG